MVPRKIAPEELEAYLDEALPAARMREIEEALRQDAELLAELRAILDRRDEGVFSLSEIWRRHRLTCPSREDLGSYLLGDLPCEVAEFIRRHLEVLGCRYCLANLEDLKRAGQADTGPDEKSHRRHQRYFRSSLRHLPPREAS